MSRLKLLLFSILIFPLLVSGEILLNDINNDGRVEIFTLGDSITAGVGDGDNRGGFPAILNKVDKNLRVINSGIPGEVFSTEGIFRVPIIARRDAIDIVLLFEGHNDSIFRTEGNVLRKSIQRMVNVMRSVNKRLFLLTLVPPCCDHKGQRPFVESYSNVIREIGAINEVPVIDIEKLFLEAGCLPDKTCSLLNVPEGLHPNELGYNVIADEIYTKLGGGITSKE